MGEWITLTEYHDTRLIVASLVIAIVGAYAALDLNQKLARSTSTTWPILLLASFTLGMSVWSMHFVGMAAFSLPISISYNWWIVGISVIPVVFGGFIAFYTLYFTKKKVWQIVTAGVLMGLGITAMHYSGMQGINFPGTIHHNIFPFVISIVIAVTSSFIVLYFLKHHQHTPNRWLLLIAAVMIGLSVSSVHYTGMAGAEFLLPVEYFRTLSNEPITSHGILGTVIAVVIITSLSVLLLATQSERHMLKHMAFHDSLTHLHNRRWLDQYFENFINKCKSSNKIPLFLLIDIDRYKWLNETFGFELGDEILLELADRLKKQVDGHGAVIRYDGNQFLMMKGIDSSQQLESVATPIMKAIKSPVKINNNKLALTATIGSTTASNNKGFIEISRELELALKAGKKAGRDRFVPFDESLHSNTREQLLYEELKNALSTKKEFTLVYQPKVELNHFLIDQAEVLMRWNHPTIGNISPSEFIPVAERSGLIQELTAWLLEAACIQLKEWKKENFFIQKIAINLSASHFQYEGANTMIRNILNRVNVDPHELKLEFEVTETSIIENIQRSIYMLEELKEMGITIALDDFGTGLSSLTYLKNLPIDTLKIDQSFISGLPGTEKDEAILETIIQLAKRLGMNVVAEGIQTVGQHSLLKKMGCHYGQGYFYSEPVRASELNKMKILSSIQLP
ncbi:putative bifunctional diguanylate cyclase/phosphodiesterase [Jeotgalibacillus soli]|uniref:Diguanylate cyclase n=1 Tax=Jeotgalibacillus soli TaxID=889306 RepID=A0A0C2VZX6_9BACL|nr:EAL domain-containing protein [Jeotgalibacillus soli]KIL49478.1 hypothetical protein KP78_09460 [Jeotgalibacillus soli]